MKLRRDDTTLKEVKDDLRDEIEQMVARVNFYLRTTTQRPSES
jgi:hypothetical protein